MLSKKRVVILVLATLLVATLVTDGEAAETRKDDKVNPKMVGAAADGSKKDSQVKSNLGFIETGNGEGR